MNLIDADKLPLTQLSCIDGRTYRVVLEDDLDKAEILDLNQFIPVKQCPCCGSKARIRQVQTDIGGDWWSVECPTCDLRTGTYAGTPYRAVESWNRRRGE